MENYRVGNLIGGGGMADVYYAMHVGLDRPVAMKVMKAWLAGDDEFVARFQREARICARMNHENIVQVYDMGTKNGRPYLVMELLQGETLRQRMRKAGAMSEEECIEIIQQVLAGLAYAHEQAGIVHRDIKPGNVFLTQNGHVKVMDFGIARAAAETRLTQTNAQLGTPEYMAPEQVEGKPVDGRSDLYAVGIMFYEMLTGDVPFKADTPLAVLHQQVTRPAPPLPDSFSPGLRSVLAKTLSKDPAGRYASAAEMLAALDRLSNGKRNASGSNFAIGRAAGPVFASLAALFAVGGVGYAAWKYIPPMLAKNAATKKPTVGKSGGKLGTAASSVKVPSLRGLSVDSARSALQKAGFKLGDQDREYSSAVGRGEVIRQTPAAGASKKKGTVVALVVSRGPEPEPEPEVRRDPQPRRQERRQEARAERPRPQPVHREAPAPKPAAPKPAAPKPRGNSADDLLKAFD